MGKIQFINIGKEGVTLLKTTDIGKNATDIEFITKEYFSRTYISDIMIILDELSIE